MRDLKVVAFDVQAIHYGHPERSEDVKTFSEMDDALSFCAENRDKYLQSGFDLKVVGS